MLTEITTHSHDVELDIRYAQTNNFTGDILYQNARCFLHQDAEKKLQKAIKLAAIHQLKVKIFDAFRPKEIQQRLWDKFADPTFVSNPKTGIVPHCRGIALDMTLIDSNNQELNMGTEFDAFTPLAHHGNTDISKEQLKNRYTLLGIMVSAGWKHNPNEWWHYQLANHEDYPPLTDQEAGTDMLA